MGVKGIGAINLMSNSVKTWSSNQVKVQRWLATPSLERSPATQTELAAEIGINLVTISRWKQSSEFMQVVYDIAEEYLGDDLPDIYAALRKEAKAGSYQHIKLAFEMTGRYVEKSEQSVKADVTSNATVNHAIDTDTAGSIFDILAAAGAIQPGVGDTPPE